MKNNSISKLLEPIVKAFRRFNITIFIITMVAGLVVAVYVLTNILTVPTASGVNGASPNETTSFDEVTIKRLRDLDSNGGNSTDHTTTSGRVNPFAE